MASTPGCKSTRKTYSFEEREILVTLANKYLHGNDEEKNWEGNANIKRKSVWSDLTDEYNSLVGLENARSTMQLRRCWENMKANKKNRDGKRTDDKVLSDNLQKSTPTVNLPPNVVFQPKDSEPFSLEGLAPNTFQVQDNEREELNIIDDKLNIANSITVDTIPDIDFEIPPIRKVKRKITSSDGKVVKQRIQVYESKMRDFNILEAQLKLDTAALLKEEAKIKLEEAQFKKEEARMRMICTSYKLQRLREYCEDFSDGDER